MSVDAPLPPLDFATFFTGKTKAVYRSHEEDGSPVTVATEESFGQIILDVQNHASLYESLESYTEPAKIDDFKTPKEYKTSAAKEVWLSQLPSFLMFQLQRVHFSTKENRPVKITSKFDFDNVIFLDRYHERHAAVVQALREEYREAKSKRDGLAAELAAYSNFQGRGVPLIEVLRLTSDYLENFHTQKRPHPRPQKGQNVQEFARFLESSLAHTEAQVAELQRQIDRLSQQLEDTYAIPELQRVSYDLHAVLVHDGVAGVGHYWAFIRDWYKGTWLKVNDTLVTEVDEATVKRDSVGGDGCPTAYCLIYLAHDVAQKYGPKSRSDLLTFLPRGLRALIEKRNRDFEEEVARAPSAIDLTGAPPYGPHPRPNTPIEPMETRTSRAAHYLDQYAREATTQSLDPRLTSVHLYLASLGDQSNLEKYLSGDDRPFNSQVDASYTSYLEATCFYNQAMKNLIHRNFGEALIYLHSMSEAEQSVPMETRRSAQIVLLAKLSLSELSDQAFTYFRAKKIDLKQLVGLGQQVVTIAVQLVPDQESSMFQNLREGWMATLIDIQDEVLEESVRDLIAEVVRAFMREVSFPLPPVKPRPEPKDLSAIPDNFTLLKTVKSVYLQKLKKLEQDDSTMDTDTEDLPTMSEAIDSIRQSGH